MTALSARAEFSWLESEAGGERQVATLCGMCPAECLITATVKDGRVVEITGTEGNPLNGGRVCQRGRAAPDLLYDPDRLKYPMKRVGPRGSGQWRRIAWSEAIDTIALKMEETLQRHGPGALALLAAGPSSGYIRELFAEFAVPALNDSHYEHCHGNREAAYIATLGFSPGAPGRLDYENCRCLLLLGSHLGENLMLPEMARFDAARRRGAKLLVADPRRGLVAERADHHLMLRPGSDTALLLGWINLLLTEEWYDREFVAAHTLGLAQLRERVAAWTPQRVAAATGLEVAEIVEGARLLAEQAPAVIVHPGRRSNRYGDEVQRLRAQAILSALLGAVGRPGGLLLPAAVEEEEYAERPRQALQRSLNHGGDDRAAAIIDGLAEKRIKLLGCWGQNPFHNFPNPYRTALAWRQAEFIFTCDVLPGEAALNADIILPEATFLERHDRLRWRPELEPQLLTARLPVLPPAFEAREPYDIVRELSIRLGRGRNLEYAEVTGRLWDELAATGVDLAYLRRHGAWARLPAGSKYLAEVGGEEFRFPTLSGKIELTSRELAEAGHDQLPAFKPPSEPPPGFLRLLTGRSPLHTNSSTQNNRTLMRQQGENELWLNETVAAEQELQAGQRVWLENQDGLSSLKPVALRLTDAIRPDCVYLVHGFGNRSPLLQTAFDQGVSDTALQSRFTVEPITGLVAAGNNFVRIVVSVQRPII